MLSNFDESEEKMTIRRNPGLNDWDLVWEDNDTRPLRERLGMGPTRVITTMSEAREPRE